jgi:hypothetical protein
MVTVAAERKRAEKSCALTDNARQPRSERACSIHCIGAGDMNCPILQALSELIVQRKEKQHRATRPEIAPLEACSDELLQIARKLHGKPREAANDSLECVASQQMDIQCRRQRLTIAVCQALAHVVIDSL